MKRLVAPALHVGILVLLVAGGCTSGADGAGRRRPAVAVGCGGGAADPAHGPLVPSCGVLWGVYPFPDRDGQGFGEALARTESAAGRRFDLVHRYHDFSDSGDNGQFPDAVELEWIAAGRIVHFGWSSNVWSDRSQRRSWPDIADGRYDAVIDAEAARLATMERERPAYRYFVDFDHEPEGRRSSGEPGQFVLAWRHIRDRFRIAGVEHAVWVWVVEDDADRARPYYPGDAWVDWIGFDPYNWSGCTPQHRIPWRTFSDVVTPTYDGLVGATWHGPKPLMLAEYGTVERAGDPDAKAAWFDAVPAALAELPALAALDYFDDGGETPGCDWTVDSSPAAAAAFRRAGLSVRTER